MVAHVYHRYIGRYRLIYYVYIYIYIRENKKSDVTKRQILSFSIDVEAAAAQHSPGSGWQQEMADREDSETSNGVISTALGAKYVPTGRNS